MKKNLNDYFDEDNQPQKQPTPDYEQFQPAPQLYVNGKLNPRYKTSRGSDLLYGLTQGAKMGLGQDPFVQLGLVIGGAIGGLRNKNSAGIPKYQQDVALNQQYNEGVAFRTNARMRLQQMEIERQRLLTNDANRDADRALQEEKFKFQQQNAGKTLDMKWLGDQTRLWASQPNSVQKTAQGEYLTQMGKQITGRDNFQLVGGDKQPTIRKYGDFSGYMEDGVLHYLYDDKGNEVSSLGQKDLLDIFQKKYKIAEDKAKIAPEEALSKANEMAFKLKFKTPAQKQAYILSMAKFLATGDPDKELTPDLDTQIGLPQQKSQEKLKEKPQESQFMPQDNSPSIQGFRDVISSYTSATTENERRNARLAVQGHFNDITSMYKTGSVNEKDYNLAKQMYESFQDSVNPKTANKTTANKTEKPKRTPSKAGDVMYSDGWKWRFNGVKWVAIEETSDTAKRFKKQ